MNSTSLAKLVRKFVKRLNFPGVQALQLFGKKVHLTGEKILIPLI